MTDNAATVDRLRRAGIVTGCREEIDTGKCGMTAEFILWGKMLPREALGPRCYNHAAQHVGHRALGDPQWAIADLRPLLDSLEVNRVGERRQCREAEIDFRTPDYSVWLTIKANSDTDAEAVAAVLQAAFGGDDDDE